MITFEIDEKFSIDMFAFYISLYYESFQYILKAKVAQRE